MLSREDIQEIIPHRNEMLLVDEAEKLNDTQAVGFYTVKGDEWFIRGHFPGHPVVPGVILCEMMAQTCALLIPPERLKGATPYFAGIREAAFKRRVVPGDTVTFACEAVRAMGNFYFCQGEGSVEGSLCVKASLSFALVREV